tara:strand:- start:5636 stop:6655 length:1020 start_codon:yes stop_codon:yes gene_type:complete
MCLIIHKPNKDAIIPDHIIDNAETINPDGFGIVFTDNNQCVRTMDYNQARELILSERPFVAHYRYATRGAVDKATCHPYHIDSYVRLFSNGTVADLGDKNTCDTLVVSKMLKRIPNEHWNDVLDMTETRFAITYPDGSVTRHGTWHEKDGVFYSKNNCFHTRKSTIGYHYGTSNYNKKWYDFDYTDDRYCYTDNAFELDDYPMSDTTSVYDTISPQTYYDWSGVDLVAVYGTLKSDKHNHCLLLDAIFLGKGKTVNKYAMQESGIPYVYEHIHRDQITVEVYEIPNQTIKDDLDRLESHPTFYERKLTDIELDDGSVRTCWLYFIQQEPIENMEYIHTY